MSKLIITSISLFLFSVSSAYASSSLAEILASEKKLEQVAAKKTVDEVFETIKSALVRGESVQIRNFGTFYLQKREARKAVNPKTKAVIDVPARNYARFRVSENFKQKLFNSQQETVAIDTTSKPLQ